MRIDVITLISGLDPEVIARRRKILGRFASPGTDVRLVLIAHAPLSVESSAEMALIGPEVLKRVVQCEREGANAVVIWGGHDPSIVAARELVSIPVIGPGMASMYIASALAEKFGLIIQLPHVLGVAERQVRDLGLEKRCVGIYSVDIPVLELRKRENFEPVRKTAVTAIEQGGADAICFGCMALTDHASPLSEVLAESHPGVVVVHPGRAALRLAELLVGMNLSHSKRSYPFPPKATSFDA